MLIIPLDIQIANFDQHIDTAISMLPAYFQLHHEAIADMARDRLVSGFDEYGDEMWQQNQTELSRELGEELADALNRLVALVTRALACPPNY